MATQALPRRGEEPAPWEDPRRESDPAIEQEVRELSRRRFLAVAGTVAAVAAVVGFTGRVLAHSRAAVEAARNRLRLPISRPSTPAGADLGVEGVAPWVTSATDFYRIDTALAIPQILPQDWELRIHGMVDNGADRHLPGPARPRARGRLDHPVLRVQSRSAATSSRTPDGPAYASPTCSPRSASTTTPTPCCPRRLTTGPPVRR